MDGKHYIYDENGLLERIDVYKRNLKQWRAIAIYLSVIIKIFLPNDKMDL